MTGDVRWRSHNPRLLVLALLAWLLPGPAATQEPARFVGGAACAGCHRNEAQDWAPSHHAKAMQPATPAAVLGNFDNATLTHHGVTTTFRRDGDGFLVRTQSQDGTLRDYPVAYTFGVFPLQQYLIAFPGGRLQALGIAWDARPQDQGGQRWYPLYPNPTPPPGDRLHWTGRDQTWNYMCADCHSTGLAKNFDLPANRYATTWTDVNVACEACHGPGSAHIAWAAVKAAGDGPDSSHKGLVAWLKPSQPAGWVMDPATGIARRTGPPPPEAQLNVCSGCHSRRRLIAATPNPAAPLLDRALPALLEPGLYFADGQIDGEVFEWGSFVQSPMFRAGVTCINCHEPHSGKLRAEGNALCAQCHLPAKFDTAAHHHHPEGKGAQCVSCHMPSRVYMGVHVRHDHGLRVPLPALSVAIGTPNVCGQCHPDHNAAWAAQIVKSWHPDRLLPRPDFAAALDAGRHETAEAGALLERLILDTAQPAIARATALAMLPRFATPNAAAALRAGITDSDPLVRLGAARALPPEPVLDLALPVLSDPLLAVRIEAARSLAGADPQGMLPESRAALDRAVAELEAAELVDADRPETHLNLGSAASAPPAAGCGGDSIAPRFGWTRPSCRPWSISRMCSGSVVASRTASPCSGAPSPPNPAMPMRRTASAWRWCASTAMRRR